MGSRLFEEAAARCNDGLRIDAGDNKLAASLYGARAKAFQMLARSRGRGETRAQREAAAGGCASQEASARGLAASEAAPQEAADDPRAGAKACWTRCLQDAGSALYYDASLLQPFFLKAEALQALERWAEAVGALEQCVNAEPSRAHDQEVLRKLSDAQFLLRKSQREDLYGTLGVKSKASEKEIRAAYKKLALEWHPDRHSGSDEASKKAAEARFKKLGETLEILTDPFKRQLWDEGHDLDSIAQRVQMRERQQQHG